MGASLVWFRGKDLRVVDHVPLADAAARASRAACSGEVVVPLFVIDPHFFAPERAKEMPHRMQYLVDSLVELAASIADLGSRLLVVHGKSTDVVPDVAKSMRVDRVSAYRWTEPVGRTRDERVRAKLSPIPFDLYEGETLIAPGDVMTQAGTPFSVFGPFSRACMKALADLPPPRRKPRSLPPLPSVPKSIRAIEVPIPTLEELSIGRSDRIVRAGEAAARARLRKFLRGAASGGARYDVGRDELGTEGGTSRISQDLKFGTLSVREVWRDARDALSDHRRARRIFSNELLWRELAYHVLWHHPRVLAEAFKPTWNGFPWRKDERAWLAWMRGTTGYPIVDAAARQLLAEGFVHNRARMIAASFLTKHLGIDFRRGEAHYMRFLTDGDWASNDLGWQWSTGCGVDAQPWFRIFNPVLQGEKFDPSGAYVRRWVPELAALGDRWIHRPWTAPKAECARVSLVLGSTYPLPIVDHAFARQRFLAAAKGHLPQSSSKGSKGEKTKSAGRHLSR